MSNCRGLVNGGADTIEVTEGETTTTQPVDIDACNDRALRVIKDQFTVRLRGNMVEPEGAAATWAFGT